MLLIFISMHFIQNHYELLCFLILAPCGRVLAYTHRFPRVRALRTGVEMVDYEYVTSESLVERWPREIGIDNPSSLSDKYLLNDYGRDIHLHAMHSVVDWFAFAHWENGVLQRSLSISPGNGVIEDLGSQKQFEKPYWQGKHPVVGPEDEYPFLI